MSVDLKTLTPDGSLPTTGFVFGADSQASASPSVYTTAAVATAVGLQFPAGAQATPSISTTGDNDTGIWFPAANTIAASTGGFERMRVSDSGNVGVGQTNPLYSIDILRNEFSTFRAVNNTGPSSSGGAGLIGASLCGAAATANSRLGFLVFQGSRDASNTPSNAVGVVAYAASNWSASNAESYLVFETTSNGSTSRFERVRIDGSGNVGIGTTSPSTYNSKLAVNGDIALVTIGQKFYPYYISATNHNYISSAAGGQMVFGTGLSSPDERMRIDVNGNVGIGTQSPSYSLDVVKNSGDVTLAIRSESSGASLFRMVAPTQGLAAFNQIQSLYGSTLSWSIGGNGSNDTIAFNIASTERMRIDTSGNLLLGGTASPTTGTQCLTVETGTAPTATPADTISLFSTDLSAGNTILSLRTEGTPVNANTTAAATHRIAVRINGTVYYLLANTSA